MPAVTNGLPELLRVGDLEIAVSVSKHRTSVGLTVERDASITAVVSPQVTMAELVRIIEAKRSWLYGKLAEKHQLGARPPARKYVSGEGFPYLGRSYRLKIVESGEVRLVRGRLELAKGRGARDLVRWYQRVGEPWLGKRVQPWASRMGAQMTGLRVRPLGYRWGSCSQDGNVNIHWATMQLPPTLIDYVLVHELAHLERRDHGHEFWRTVERTMPGYEVHRERLRRASINLWLAEERQ